MENLFDFMIEDHLFHFLAEQAGGDIVLSGAPLLDMKPAQPESEKSTAAVKVAGVNASAVASVSAGASAGVGVGMSAGSGVGVGTTQNDPFLKQLKDTSNKGESLVMQSLVQTEEKNAEKKKSILGELPKLDTSLFIDREYHLKKQLSVVRGIFFGLMAVGFAVYAYFSIQLNPDFTLIPGYETLGVQLNRVNTEMKSTKTAENFYRFQMAKTSLDQFFYQANEYLEKYDTWKNGSDADKPKLLAVLEDAKRLLVKPFETARDQLGRDIFEKIYRDRALLPDVSGVSEADLAARDREQAVTEFQDLLRAYVDQQVSSLNATGKKADVNSERDNQLRAYTELLKLIGNKDISRLVATDIGKMSHEDVRAFILQISTKYPHRLAYIFRLKDKRVAWSDIINEINKRTGEIDNGRYKIKLFNRFGGIRYTGFDFDGGTGKITVSGVVKDFEAKNFSILADLIDILERSRMFKNAGMRSFSKTFVSDKDGYDANFKVDLELQTAAIDSGDKVIDLSALPSVSPNALPSVLSSANLQDAKKIPALATPSTAEIAPTSKTDVALPTVKKSAP